MTTGWPDVSARYLIGGQWRKASDAATVHNPASTREIVGEVALCTKQDVAEAIDSAADAFASWSRSELADRANRMSAAARELQAVVEQNVPLFVRENGKVLVEAKKDLLRCVQIMAGGAEELLEWWHPEKLESGAQKVQIRKRPRGVTAVITPWNSPLILTFKRVVPAVLAGNTVIVKPATNCPLTVMTFLQIVAAHFPPGVINIVTGSGSMIGGMLCTDPRVRTIAFVGGTETGKEIMRLSAGTVKKLYMELGGNDPALVLDDAVLDADTVQRLRFGILRAAGQVCSAVKRVYVHESRYEELVDKLAKEFGRVVVGNGIQPDATMGPLNNKSQFDFVRSLVERAQQSGAQVIRAGRKLNPETWEDGYFMEPAIVTGADQGSEIVKEEQFGPVIPVIPFSDADEAVALANDTEFGLRASVWTADEARAAELADRLEAGAVFHNNHTIFQDLHLDFPGLKESGLSRETRHCALELFTDTYGFAN
ncbi:hypothetical protein SD70_22265 [Gordoniibacillus kamchatkensis]|uniref:Aldehyde dehydrogenase domain-containing protein n=1 Tax=Gordoniibacillus kamchatkensis TaxID=1590651 RepID=A0ABR5ADD8_9BACL|nr:aldehyde dehydrogenase family protein [Paenibacillus sp. VKM B-2647]KIL39059.1 hypothetical protein SD70_22265 [Paenibacillus sp. VKM B-2647]